VKGGSLVGDADSVIWDQEFDVVVVGAGAGGMVAALSAQAEGASVAVVEANFSVGGRAILSGGAPYLGGGTSAQRAAGVEDSPEALFRDWIRPDSPLGRYNDRELVWAHANASVETFEFVTAAGIEWVDLTQSRVDSVPRRNWAREWADPAGVVVPGQGGSGLMRPMEAAARERGVEILLQHRMTKVHRAQGDPDEEKRAPVVGITTEKVDEYFQPTGQSVNIRARQAVILATGGHSMNVEFRRIFDPRLTEEYQSADQNWSPKNADGELAALAIGASLWGTANQTNEFDGQLAKGTMARRSNYHGLIFSVDSPHFFREKATGLRCVDYQNVVLVRENGVRFYDETAGRTDYEYFAAAMSWSGDLSKLNGGGPIWAIFDSDAVQREGWGVEPPYVDTNGFFFTADTVEELAEAIQMEYQWRPMPPENLRATIERYNQLVDEGCDIDFGKPAPSYRIQTPPFYAAWHTPSLLDTFAGLKINTNAQVIDLAGDAIPGLYAAGDCTGGFSLHGIGKAFTFGRLAGKHAARQPDAAGRLC
jgi:urocanate reductase